ncbi:alpha/beta-hydrolase [Basidiobolus meristosporus CBS 931.73]|uniref:Alpha/beta-hydrolase n=1 Tax=Basidiobolus meristosporus CBS 931.73 TaxID=1314790 RepID=A0A1Y1X8N7_9FUNG|nr:alpha/beta-hydrolase [Basidiobolus meristosporus CBS 931.73]|eukprot:ORX82092.1 alpha/beta-hydrolase [Basidiobolus meristosporus CBS 931.73]
MSLIFLLTFFLHLGLSVLAADYSCSRPKYFPSQNRIYKSFKHFSVDVRNNGTNARLHYVREGPKDGETVVLIHGYPQSWYEWRNQIPQLAKAGYQVIAFDTRGQGESSIPDDGYDALTVATDLHLALASLNITEKVHIVTHDIGVWIGYAYVHEFNREVASFTVSGSPVPGETLGNIPSYPRPGTFKWWFASLQSEPSPFPEELVRCKERLYFNKVFDYLMLPDTRSGINQEDFDEYIRILTRKNEFRAGNDYYRNFWNTIDIYSSRGYYNTTLTIPVFAVMDTLLGSLVADSIKEYASNVESQEYHGGHFIWEEAPKATTAGLINFLNRVSAMLR